MHDKKIHTIEVGQSDASYFRLTVDGRTYQILWRNCSPLLQQATMAQRRLIEITPSGYGLHWPLLDEDLAIDPLLQLAETVEKLVAA